MTIIFVNQNITIRLENCLSAQQAEKYLENRREHCIWVSERDADVGAVLSQQENQTKAKQARTRYAVAMAAAAVQPTICRVFKAGFPGPTPSALGMVQGAGTRSS